jgi:hypothetical protein
MNAEQSGPFGGLTPEEAGRKSAEKQRLRRELEEKDPQQVIIVALVEQAKRGNAQAVRELRELGVLTPQTPQHKDDRTLLDLLTRDQRTCIEAALQGQKVPRELALDAWSR